MTRMPDPTPTPPTSVSFEEAVALLRSDGAARHAERRDAVAFVPLAEARARILAQDLTSTCDHPNVDDSSLDGIACRIEDTRDASPAQPVSLELIGDAAAGRPFPGHVATGQATWIQTGAAVPDGADGIIPVEALRRDGDRVWTETVADANAIRRRGQDVRMGDVGLTAGRRIDAACVALAAAMGHATVPVTRRLRVAVLTSGDEVVPPGGALQPGDVFDANGPALHALLHAAGADVVALDTVRDDAGALEDVLASAGSVDLFLTSGGISMGRYDRIRDLLEQRSDIVFRKVLLKPGGPATFAILGGLPWLALPGNPVSSMVTFLALGRAWLDAASGSREPLPLEQTIPARAGAVLRSAGAKMTLLRVTLTRENDQVTARPTGSQNSGIVRSLADADALALVPPHTTYDEGDLLDVVPLAPHVR